MLASTKNYRYRPAVTGHRYQKSWIWNRIKNRIQLGAFPNGYCLLLTKLLTTYLLCLAESMEWFQEIKANLGLAVAVRELRPGLLSTFKCFNVFKIFFLVILVQ